MCKLQAIAFVYLCFTKALGIASFQLFLEMERALRAGYRASRGLVYRTRY